MAGTLVRSSLFKAQRTCRASGLTGHDDQKQAQKNQDAFALIHTQNIALDNTVSCSAAVRTSQIESFEWLIAYNLRECHAKIGVFVLINADKPHLWKTDVTQSVYQFNAWFMEFAPVEYRNTRQATTEYVKNALIHTQDLAALTPAMLKAHPNVLPTLRMATAPPLARDRLIGLAGVNSSLVQTMEKNKLPKKMNAAELDRQLCRICEIISEVLDRDIFGWLDEGREAGEHERERTSMIVADRLCGSMADPIIRNAHEKRQLALIEALLAARGYRRVTPPPGQDIKQMTAGTYCYRLNVPVNVGERQFNIPIDVVIQPKITSESGMPILIEAKSAGDFTNTNKRRKEEAIKIQQLRQTYGAETRLYLFLCGYFDAGYLGYEASEGLDWIWEHRVEDLLQLGL